MLTRRQLIKTGVFGCALLAGTGYWALAVAQPESPHDGASGFLTARDAAMIAAIAPAMLAVESLPVAEVVRGVDTAIRALPLALQREVRQLFDLLGNPLGRRFLAGVAAPWHEAAPESVAVFLRRWQLSGFSLLRTGYQALHALLSAAWYGNQHSWAALGYQRPARIMGFLS